MSASLSTHVLDTATGRPATGVRVELRRGHDEVAVAETDADGRARLAEAIAPGLYALVFHPPSAFFRRVELEIEIGEGHHHVPLLISPYGCTTYRGT